jgi:hypothetical protein
MPASSMVSRLQDIVVNGRDPLVPKMTSRFEVQVNDGDSCPAVFQQPRITRPTGPYSTRIERRGSTSVGIRAAGKVAAGRADVSTRRR